MSLQNSIAKLPLKRGFAWVTQRGWIGVDIGTSAIKLSQVERQGSQYHISARWTLPNAANKSLDAKMTPEEMISARLTELKSLRRIFSGRNCAAVLPMSMVQLRSLELPKSEHSEQFRMVGEELSADLAAEPEDLAYGCWSTGSEAQSNAELIDVSVIAAPKALVEQIANRLLSAGLACQALNGMPCALARAVQMANLQRPEETVLALDMGSTSPMIVVVKNGFPLFTRTMRGVGLQSIMQPLETGLQISTEECQELLSHYGVARVDESPSLATQKTMQLIANPLQNLVAEIKRTIEYVGQKFRSSKPARLSLFGGGALVKNFPEYLSHQLQLPVNAWSLDDASFNKTDALYGVACGLSSLAFESSPCS
jgi:type IV pilus assembly protein PilM